MSLEGFNFFVWGYCVGLLESLQELPGSDARVFRAEVVT